MKKVLAIGAHFDDVELAVGGTLNKISKNINIPILAHGGCGDPKDVLELAQNTNVSGAVIASFFHYNSISRFKKFVSK